MEGGDQLNPGSGDTDRGSQVLLWLEKNLALIRLGSPNERVILLNEERMESLAQAIASVRNQPEVRGLVIIGPNERLFSAGADVNVVQGIVHSDVGRRLAKRGQEIFNEIEQLPFPTVAAISGACVGGACELALSCRYRVVANVPQTRIGLPEVRLGIIPGFGGTQRLPRLIGVRRALELILKGRLLDAEHAAEIGLADALITPTSDEAPRGTFERLEEFAVDLALGRRRVVRRKLGIVEWFFTSTAPGRRIVENRVRKEVAKEGGGKYPAPVRAIDVIFSGLEKGVAVGLDEEANAIGELIVSPESKALVHLFFRSEEATKLGRTAKLSAEEERIAVIGAGTMGSGIAAAFIATGAKVVLIDTIEAARNRAREQIRAGLEKRRSLSEKRREELFQNLTVAPSLDEIRGSTLVVEAVIEDLKLKRELFAKIAELVDAKTILASNTSSLSLSEIARDVRGRERVIGMHFFNPVGKMPLVELIQGEATNDRTVVYTAAYVSLLGKYPVVVRDVPGFLVNRILSPYLVEAAQLLSEGVEIEYIDEIAVGFGMPIGPFRLLDEVGLDVAAKVADIMVSAYGARMEGPNFAAKLLEVGRLGRKTGKGFYRYEDGKHFPDPDLASLLRLRSGQGGRPKEASLLVDRLVLAMVNEAVRCFDLGVAGSPGREAAGQIDLASVMGFGFPAYQGGVLRYAEQRGSQNLLKQLADLERRYGSRFAPAPGIQLRGEQGKSFYEPVAGTVL